MAGLLLHRPIRQMRRAGLLLHGPIRRACPAASPRRLDLHRLPSRSLHRLDRHRLPMPVVDLGKPLHSPPSTTTHPTPPPLAISPRLAWFRDSFSDLAARFLGARDNRSVFLGWGILGAMYVLAYALLRARRKPSSPPDGMEWWRWEIMEFLKSVKKVVGLKPDSAATTFETGVFLVFTFVNYKWGVQAALVTVSVWIACFLISRLLKLLGGEKKTVSNNDVYDKLTGIEAKIDDLTRKERQTD